MNFCPPHRNPITVPVGIANPENDGVFCLPKSLLTSKYQNIMTYEVMEGVGHFAAYQAPDKLFESITGFVNKVEKMTAISALEQI